MRTIGNIERFLVIGIVVVIGAILTVAITGAQDLKRERDQAAAKTAPPKKSTLPLKTNEPRIPRTLPEAGKKDAPRDEAGVQRPVDPGADSVVKELLDAKLNAGKGGGAPAVPPAGPGADPKTPKQDGLSQNEGSGIAEAPVVLGEAGKHDVRPLLDKNEPAPPSDSGLTPPQPKHEPGAPPASGSKVYVYEVQKGDTLERIARALYGDGQRWREIAAANPTIGDGQKIRAGDHLTLNAAPTHESSAVVAKEPGAALPAPKPETPNAAVATAFKRTTAQEQYQVQKGDTLMSIAAANYGTKAAWRLILDANADKIPDKDRIKTGIVLKLPTN